MPISFNSAPSYFWLNTWVLSNIIELATQSFCDRFIDYRIDPGHRLYDQMTQAARSIAPTCPQCGKPMLRRTIKRGNHQGQQFWGCSAYPNCTATINI